MSTSGSIIIHGGCGETFLLFSLLCLKGHYVHSIIHARKGGWAFGGKFSDWFESLQTLNQWATGTLF